MREPPRPGAIASLISEAYRPEVTVDAWARRLTHCISAATPGALGSVGRVLDLDVRRPRGGYLIGESCTPEIAESLAESARTSHHRVDLVQHGRGLRRFCFGELPEALRGDRYLLEQQRRFHAYGLEDMFHLTATDPNKRVCVTVGVLTQRGTVPPGTPAQWGRVAAHFDAALDLQLRTETIRHSLASDCVMFNADGVLLDNSTPARLPLSFARIRAAAREHSRADAQEVWCGIVDGRWSVIARYDQDGRRYVLAIPIRAAVQDPRGLTPREVEIVGLVSEGHSDKWIGLTIGLARSTVATHLQAAMKKLGICSRVELARSFSRRSGSARPSKSVPRPPFPSELRAYEHGVEDSVFVTYPSQTNSTSNAARPTPLLDTLTQAQRAVVALAVEGASDEEIARRTRRSRHTVSNLLRQAYGRLGVVSRIELAARLNSDSPAD